MSTYDRQLGGIRRPSERVPDLFRFEVGDSFSASSVERLKPEIAYTTVAHGINHTLAVMREAKYLPGRPLEIHELYGLTGVDVHYRQAWTVVAGMFKGGKDRPLSIRRNIKGTGAR